MKIVQANKGMAAFSNQVNPSKRYCGVFCPAISRKSNIFSRQFIAIQENSGGSAHPSISTVTLG